MNKFKHITRYIFLCIFILCNLLGVNILSSKYRLDFIESIYLIYIFLIIIFIYTIFDSSLRKITPGNIVFYYSLVTFFGVGIAYILDNYTVLQYINRSKALYGVYIDKYFALGIISISSFLLGKIIYYKKKNLNKIKQNIYKENNTFLKLGFLFLILFTIYMGVNFLLGKIPINNYLAYKSWAGNQVRNYLQILYWFGCVLIVCNGKKKDIAIAFIIFLIPSSILMLTGNRNDVLYPLLISLGIYKIRFKEIPKILVIMVLIIVFVISPMIAETRSDGVSISVNSNILTNISSSFLELGSQFIPVSNMFMWLEQGESYAYGGTFIYGTLAFLFGLIDNNIRTLYFSSRYCISRRLPALAFSMAGEMFFNFGAIGVIIIYFLLGRYIAIKENSTFNSYKLMIYSFTMFLFLHLVRNQFEFTISYVIIIIIIIIVKKILDKEIVF